MVNLADSDKKFIRDNFSNAEQLLQADDYRTILDVLFDLIEEKGYAPPHYYDYNDFGRKTQKIYDSVYFLNVKK